MVIGPVLRDNRSGSAPPRIVETNGGFARQTELQNRGVVAIIRHFSKLWPRMGCPVIAQIAESDPERISSIVQQICAVGSLRGLELVVPRNGDVTLARVPLHRVLRYSDLPVWIKLQLDTAASWASVLIEEEVCGIAVGQPLSGVLFSTLPDATLSFPDGAGSDNQRCTLVKGEVFGPLAFAPMLYALMSVARMAPPCSLLACGGIPTQGQVKQAFAAGANAVQIDGAVWVGRGLAGQLAEQFCPNAY